MYAPNYTGPRLFGAPVGDFSFLQTILLTVATGVASFFGTTFIAIISVLVLTQVTHRNVDYSITYRWFGLPVGIAMFLIAGIYLSSLLAMRIRRKSDAR